MLYKHCSSIFAENYYRQRRKNMKKGILLGIALLFTIIPGILFGQILNFQKTQVTTGAVTDETPAWSPNSDKIAFASNRSGNSDIWVVNANGTGLAQLTNSGLEEKYPSWNPAGTQIAYILQDPNAGEWGHGYFLYTMNADGSGKTVRPLPPGSGQEPTDTFWNFEMRYTAWSPDGAGIAFVSYGPDGGSMKIYLYNLTNNQVTEITPAGEANPFGMIFRISWCWTTNLLAFDRYPIGVQTFTPGSANLQVLNIPRQPQPGMMDADVPLMAGWNPSGTKVAYVTDLYGTQTIGIFDQTSGTSISEAAPDGHSWPAFSPDGTKIAVSKDNIWILTVPLQPLYAEFAGDGLYEWSGASWSKLTGSHPANIVNSGSFMYADFAGDGLYSWNGSAWNLLTRDHPTTMLASGSRLYAYFASYGLYQWDGSAWTLLTRDQPVEMLASGSYLYAFFSGDGLYSWNGTTWTLLTRVHQQSMVASGPILHAFFTGDGLYMWNGMNWTLLTKDQPSTMLASGSMLYADFAGWGVYCWNGSAWAKLTSGHPVRMVASGSLLHADFAGDGLYTWNGTTWILLTRDHPVNFLATGSLLFADFASYGLYAYDGSAWIMLTGSHPQTMLAN
jgi:hypothetical protein